MERVRPPYDLRRGIGEPAPARPPEQSSLFPKRASTIYPGRPNGADIAFICAAAEGGTYYCKTDNGARPARATEWFGQCLAKHIGISVPEFTVIEDNDGETYFGSLSHTSTASQTHLTSFLLKPNVDELRRRLPWPGRYLSGLYSLDMFLANPDRDFTNFVLVQEGSVSRLCAIDFAAADLVQLTGQQFPIAHTRTVLVGKILRDRHGFFADSALEMVDRIAAVPRQVVEGFVGEIPADWLSEPRRKEICAGWSGPSFQNRLSALRAGIKDGSLL